MVSIVDYLAPKDPAPDTRRPSPSLAFPTTVVSHRPLRDGFPPNDAPALPSVNPGTGLSWILKSAGILSKAR